MQITRNGIDTNVGPADWFTGAVYVDTLATPSAYEVIRYREERVRVRHPEIAR